MDKRRVGVVLGLGILLITGCGRQNEGMDKVVDEVDTVQVELLSEVEEWTEPSISTLDVIYSPYEISFMNFIDTHIPKPYPYEFDARGSKLKGSEVVDYLTSNQVAPDHSRRLLGAHHYTYTSINRVLKELIEDYSVDRLYLRRTLRGQSLSEYDLQDVRHWFLTYKDQVTYLLRWVAERAVGSPEQMNRYFVTLSERLGFQVDPSMTGSDLTDEQLRQLIQVMEGIEIDYPKSYTVLDWEIHYLMEEVSSIRLWQAAFSNFRDAEFLPLSDWEVVELESEMNQLRLIELVLFDAVNGLLRG